MELYDLKSDPNEFTNLAGDTASASILASLDAALWRWLEEVDDPVLRGPVVTPYYRSARAALGG